MLGVACFLPGEDLPKLFPKEELCSNNDELQHYLWHIVQEPHAANGCHQLLQNAVNHPYFTLLIVKSILHFTDISRHDGKFQFFHEFIAKV